jgi:hypothetical protein
MHALVAQPVLSGVDRLPMTIALRDTRGFGAHCNVSAGPAQVPLLVSWCASSSPDSGLLPSVCQLSSGFLRGSGRAVTAHVVR